MAMTATATAAYVTSDGRPTVSVICDVTVVVRAGCVETTVVVAVVLDVVVVVVVDVAVVVAVVVDVVVKVVVRPALSDSPIATNVPGTAGPAIPAANWGAQPENTGKTIAAARGY